MTTWSDDVSAFNYVGVLTLFLVLGCVLQGAGLVMPGDGRVDAGTIRAYRRRYAVYSVPSSGMGTRVELIGSLTEDVELVRRGRDTALLRVRELTFGGREGERDSIILDRRSLAPLIWRTWSLAGTFSSGARFDGREVSYVGSDSSVALDTVLPRPGFLDGTETLLIPLLLTKVRATPLRVSTVGFDDMAQVFATNDVGLTLVRPTPPPAARDTVGLVVVRFGGSQYWINRGNGEVVQWEEPSGEGGFGLRFVLKGP
jgi:hypothetical protein